MCMFVPYGIIIKEYPNCTTFHIQWQTVQIKINFFSLTSTVPTSHFNEISLELQKLLLKEILIISFPHLIKDKIILLITIELKVFYDPEGSWNTWGFYLIEEFKNCLKIC